MLECGRNEPLLYLRPSRMKACAHRCHFGARTESIVLFYHTLGTQKAHYCCWTFSRDSFDVMQATAARIRRVTLWLLPVHLTLKSWPACGTHPGRLRSCLVRRLEADARQSTLQTA